MLLRVRLRAVDADPPMRQSRHGRSRDRLRVWQARTPAEQSAARNTSDHGYIATGSLSGRNCRPAQLDGVSVGDAARRLAAQEGWLELRAFAWLSAHFQAGGASLQRHS